MLVGFGAGRTASRVIQALGHRVKTDSFEVRVVAASEATEALCREVGLEVIDFATVENSTCSSTAPTRSTGRCGCSRAPAAPSPASARSPGRAERRVYMVGSEKVSPYLGMNCTLSIAVMPFGLASTRASVRRLGLNGVMRRGLAGELYVTDNANLILEVSLPEGLDLEELDTELHRIPGVVEHGLFLDEADAILIEHQTGEIETLSRIHADLRERSCRVRSTDSGCFGTPQSDRDR
jgi:ribose 5-phosphate isomerase A